LKTIDFVVLIITSICVTFLISFIIMNFLSQNKSKSVKQKKSIVATGSMFFFFLIYYLVILIDVGNYTIETTWLNILLIFIGLVILIFGTFVNCVSRLSLGKNWANQIKIYEDQTLVNKGFYKLIRHPLYASLIWMFYAGGLVFSNYILLILNTVIFIPFMYYRAKQEETLLLSSYNEYNEYQKKIGMFFPRIRRVKL